jgi:hypothetical protein
MLMSKTQFLFRDARLLELRTSARDREHVDGHRLLLDAHHQREAIGKQSANHVLGQAPHVAFRRTGRNGVGGCLGLDVVGLAPVAHAGQPQRGVERHVVGVAHEERHGQRARLEVAVGQHSHADVARVAGRRGLDRDRFEAGDWRSSAEVANTSSFVILMLIISIEIRYSCGSSSRPSVALFRRLQTSTMRSRISLKRSPSMAFAVTIGGKCAI